MSYSERLKLFDKLLQDSVIDLPALKKLCFEGIPDNYGIRGVCWRFLLNYFPECKNERIKIVDEKRRLYKQLVEELIVTPGDHVCNNEANSKDHPLSISPESQWQGFFKDNEVLLQIDKDVRRLCPDISFFQQPTDYPCGAILNNRDAKRLHSRVRNTELKCANIERRGLGITKLTLSAKKAQEDYAPMPDGKEAHWEVVERILFLYAKLNPGQGYVQGMNEIIGPIYYVFASDSNQSLREHAECDSFFCFTNLMSEIRDFFIKTLDEADCGINKIMSLLQTQLKRCDFDVWHKFQQLDLKPQYYSFRWLTLLLSQEFSLPDVLRIWDSLLSDEKRFDLLIHVCCAMIVLIRSQLLSGDFSMNVKLLQNYPPIDVQRILSKAMCLSKMHSLQ